MSIDTRPPITPRDVPAILLAYALVFLPLGILLVPEPVWQSWVAIVHGFEADRAASLLMRCSAWRG